MSKIRTLNDLQDILDKEFAWRIMEINTLKQLVKKSNSISKTTSVRASIPLLYGHWEGFIKISSTKYVEYVNNQRLNLNKLKSCFIIFGIKKEINNLVNSKSSSISIKTLEFIRNNMNSKAKLTIDQAIHTDSNLNSKVFTNIALSIGLDITRYEARFNLIDESLLKRRNSIAHGEYLDIDSSGFIDLADEVLSLLRTYKTDIENSASSKFYLA